MKQISELFHKTEAVSKRLLDYKPSNICMVHMWYFCITLSLLLWFSIHIYRYIYKKYKGKNEKAKQVIEETHEAKSQNMLLCTTNTKNLLILISFKLCLVTSIIISTYIATHPDKLQTWTTILSVVFGLSSLILSIVYLYFYISTVSISVDTIKRCFDTLDKFFFTFVETNVNYAFVVLTFLLFLNNLLVCITQFSNNITLQLLNYIYTSITLLFAVIFFIFDMIYLQICSFIFLPYVYMVLVVGGTVMAHSNIIDPAGIHILYGIFVILVILLLGVRLSKSTYKNIIDCEKEKSY